MSCKHVFAICHLSDAPFGSALVCTACKVYLCPDPACNAPVFAKHCPSGLKRAHFAHYGGTDAARSGCTGGSPESVEHLRAKEALRDLVLSCHGRCLTIKENSCGKGHHKATAPQRSTACKTACRGCWADGGSDRERLGPGRTDDDTYISLSLRKREFPERSNEFRSQSK